ncbi:autotransporter-associated beta strand repeat-containing protein [Luteolibacter flavescens]|uniref:Autotransporter-associated beta strand repeat-containing protein n=1 Tax=Luteolibacter flavescens TaxID=1859460 RepID=A0ABT3FM77_9BACT|nr:autotransporter-associated beta strand repeat-containing protein [Luteolibacter flavescens]MCW1884299.1 autotransporter-associated beta strand repeat-containing protein [Luteolibacter flavescens]
MKPKDMYKTRITSRSALLASALVLATAAPSAMAITSNWLNNGTTPNGNWGDAVNWSAGIPTSAGDVANFNLNYSTNNKVVSLAGTSRTVGALTFGDPGSAYWTVTINGTGGGSLIFDNLGSPATITKAAANNNVLDQITAPVVLNSSLVIDTAAVGDVANQGGNSIQVTGVVSGSGGVTKNGTGAIYFTVANTYTGGTTLNAGKFHVSNNAGFGTGPITMNGGEIVPRAANRNLGNALVVQADFTAGVVGINNQLNFSGATNLNGGTRTITVNDTTVANDVVLSGVVSNGGLTKAGAGTLLVSNANTYTGPTTVTAGTLTVSNAQPFDTSSGVTVNGSGARFLIAANSLSTNILPPVTLTQGTVEGPGIINSLTVADAVANTVIPGNGLGAFTTVNSLTFQGAATLNIRANGPYAEQFILSQSLTTTTPASVVVNMTNTAGSWTSGSDYTVIDYETYTSVGNASHFVLGTMPGLNPTQTATLVNTGSEIVVRVTGETLKWTGNQSSDWTTAAVGGSRNWSQQSNPAEFTNGSAVSFDDGATRTDVNLASNVTPSITIIEAAFTDYVIGSTNGSGIQGGSLTKSLAGKLTLSTPNTYTGATTINGGILEVTGAGSIASSSTITNDAQLILNLDGASNVYANPIAGANAGTITKSGTGNLTLSGANTFTGGLVLDAGSLNLNSAGALGGGTTGIFTIHGGTTLDNTSAADVVLTSSKRQTWGGDFTFTGTHSLDMGSGEVTANGLGTDRIVAVNGSTLTVGELKSPAHGITKTGSGTLVLTSVGSFGAASVVNGTLAVNGGTVQMNRPGATEAESGDLTVGGLTGTGTIVNGASHARTLVVNTAGTNTNTFSGTLANGGSASLWLAKQGTGTLILNSANTHNGTTRVETGIMVLQNGGALGGSTYTNRTRTGALHIEGGITIPNNLILSNDGTGTGAIGYAVSNVSGNNVISGNISLLDGGGHTIIRSMADSLSITGNVTNGFNVLRNLILGGTSTAANSVSGVISNGVGANTITAVEKIDAGTWTLSGDNTYTGSTTVTAGTLSITKPVLSDTSAVVIGATGAVLNLTHTSTDQVGSLTINGQVKANGVYDSSTDPGFITGTGKIRVGPPPAGNGYTAWASSYPFTVGVNDGPEQDADGDGISNVLEYVLGGIPVGPGSNDLSILPKQTLDANDLILTFRRSDASEADAVVKVQFSTTLGSWTDFATLGPVSAGGVTITEDSPSADFDTVVVRIPRTNAVGQKLFGRVVATKP